MKIDLFFARVAIVLICWWFLPMLVVVWWIHDCLKGGLRLSLRRDLEIVFDVLRADWKGETS